jgi:type II secretory pathway pseudopilin PulG
MNNQIYKYTNKRIKGFTPATKNLVWGFTIVELLVYMALMGIFLLVLLDVFTTTMNSRLMSESTSTLNQDSRYILSKLSYEINNADSVATPQLGITGSSLQIITNGITSTYASNSGNLTKNTGGVSMSLNGIDTLLEALTFKNIGNAGGKPTIQIMYTLRSKVITQGNKTETQTINTTVGTR